MRKQLTPKMLILALLLVGAIGGGHNIVAAEKNPTPARPTPPSMTKEELQTFLARPLIARLATVRPTAVRSLFPCGSSTKMG